VAYLQANAEEIQLGAEVKIASEFDAGFKRAKSLPGGSGRTASSWRFRPRKTGICGSPIRSEEQLSRLGRPSAGFRSPPAVRAARLTRYMFHADEPGGSPIFAPPTVATVTRHATSWAR
jgi:hypothetical protein